MKKPSDVIELPIITKIDNEIISDIPVGNAIDPAEISVHLDFNKDSLEQQQSNELKSSNINDLNDDLKSINIDNTQASYGASFNDVEDIDKEINSRVENVSTKITTNAINASVIEEQNTIELESSNELVEELSQDQTENVEFITESSQLSSQLPNNDQNTSIDTMNTVDNVAQASMTNIVQMSSESIQTMQISETDSGVYSDDLISSIIDKVINSKHYEEDMLMAYKEIENKIDILISLLNSQNTSHLIEQVSHVISEIGVFKQNIQRESVVDFNKLIQQQEDKLKQSLNPQHNLSSTSQSSLSSVSKLPRYKTKKPKKYDFSPLRPGQSEKIKDRTFNISYYIYRPNLQDRLDVAFAKTVNQLLLTFPISWIQKGKYKFECMDDKIINIKLRGHQVMVRVGGGYVDLKEYLLRGYFKQRMMRHQLSIGMNKFT